MTVLQKAACYIWISVNPRENLGGRDDALMELQDYDYSFVQSFLEYFVCRTDEDEGLIDQATHSLLVIWKRKEIQNDEVISAMAPAAKNLFLDIAKTK